MCAHALMGLLPDSVAIDSGTISFEGQNLLTLDETDWRDLRGRRIAMVFQEPMTALNPLLRIGEQMTEVFEAHGLLSPRERRRRAVELARAFLSLRGAPVEGPGGIDYTFGLRAAKPASGNLMKVALVNNVASY